MDVSRFSYSRDCKFFRDDDRVSKIKWYVAPEGAKTFPTVHAFGHLSWWSEPWNQDGIGEQYSDYQHWRPGSTPPTATGQNYFGKIEDFQQGAKFDPDLNVDRDQWGLPKSCALPSCFILKEKPDYPAIRKEDGGAFLREVCPED